MPLILVIPLKCFDCFLGQFENSDNPSETPQCFISPTNYGTLKECSGLDSACAKGTARK